MSFKYYDIPMFALTNETEVADLLKVEGTNCKIACCDLVLA